VGGAILVQLGRPLSLVVRHPPDEGVKFRLDTSAARSSSPGRVRFVDVEEAPSSSSSLSSRYSSIST
jgi:hypothetical protein